MQEKILIKQKHRTSNIHSSEFGSVSYDIFGSPYQKTGSFLADDSLDFGYLGKPYNADTELYDYGFRDYSPEIARFTTVDPIRDGRNWYCYVVNDPVNYVDLWGLCGSDENIMIIKINPDPDFLLLQQEDKLLEEALKSFQNGIDANSSFYRNYSACDEYITVVMKTDDILPNNWPDPDSNRIAKTSKYKGANYVDTLKTSLKETPNPGISAVFMTGGKFPDEPHTVLIYRDKQGKILSTEFTQVTNIDENGNEITIRTIVNSEYSCQDDFESNYGYNNFYYYGIMTL